MFILIGIVGGVLLNIGCIPQIIKLFKTKKAKDLSLSSYLIYFCGIALLTIYSVHIKDLLLIVLNIVGLLGLLVIIAGILLYGRFSIRKSEKKEVNIRRNRFKKFPLISLPKIGYNQDKKEV